jgi:hypothetical protein
VIQKKLVGTKRFNLKYMTAIQYKSYDSKTLNSRVINTLSALDAQSNHDDDQHHNASNEYDHQRHGPARQFTHKSAVRSVVIIGAVVLAWSVVAGGRIRGID